MDELDEWMRPVKRAGPKAVALNWMVRTMAARNENENENEQRTVC
jgi:hypothetical protein